MDSDALEWVMDEMADLKDQIQALQNRVKEIELKNERDEGYDSEQRERSE